MTSKTTQAFRPYLTQDELMFLLNLVSSPEPETETTKSPIRESVRIKLLKLSLSIQSNLVQPAYLVRTPPEKKEKDLELKLLLTKYSEDPAAVSGEDFVKIYEYKEKRKEVSDEETKRYLQIVF